MKQIPQALATLAAVARTSPDARAASSTSPVVADARCPLCRSSSLTDFFEVPALPVFVCVLYDSPEEAWQAPLGRIHLSYCHDCGFVFNRACEPEKVRFQPGYDASLAHSSVFRDYMHLVAQRLIERYDLQGRSIIEVGCGEGYFLQLLANLGGNHCIGFDPTIVTPGPLSVDRGSVDLVRDMYTKECADLPCDFLCSLSVLEALAQPQEFVTELLDTLGDRRVDSYFEVYNGYGAIQRQQTWSIHYEQCTYFSERSFAALFSSNGFAIRAAGSCYESGEYVFVEAQSPGAGGCTTRLRAADGEFREAIERFQSTHQQSLNAWSETLDDHTRRGQSVVVWGSGGKGTSFLNAFSNAAAIQCVVDINPTRQGKFVAGSGHKIVAPHDLVDLQPDTVIITNPVYQQEIKNQVQQLGLHPLFLLA